MKSPTIAGLVRRNRMIREGLATAYLAIAIVMHLVPMAIDPFLSAFSLWMLRLWLLSQLTMAIEYIVLGFDPFERTHLIRLVLAWLFSTLLAIVYGFVGENLIQMTDGQFSLLMLSWAISALVLYGRLVKGFSSEPFFFKWQVSEIGMFLALQAALTGVGLYLLANYAVLPILAIYLVFMVLLGGLLFGL